MSEHTGIMAPHFMSITMKMCDCYFLFLPVFRHCSGPQLPSDSRAALSSKHSPISAHTVPRKKKGPAWFRTMDSTASLLTPTPLQGWGCV